METTTLYIPQNAVNLKDYTVPQVRAGIQGYPGTGKTWGALTFPNPLVLNMDNKLGAHIGRDIPQIKFYEEAWWNKYKKPNEERYEGVLRWLQTEARKLSPEQTLVNDSWTTLMNWFDIVVGKMQFMTAQGKEDGFKFWKLKAQFGQDVCEALKMLSCNSVTTFHETVDRDENSRVIGLKPLMNGSFADQLAGNFTDWFRAIVVEKKDDKGNTIGSDYLWQVRSDSKVKCLTSKIIPDNLQTVEAHYKYFTTNFTAK